MLMFYHHDRFNRVFANYESQFLKGLTRRKPEGFEEACQRVYDIVDQAKTVLTVSRKRWTYNFIHFSQDPMDRRLVRLAVFCDAGLRERSRKLHQLDPEHDDVRPADRGDGGRQGLRRP